MKVKIGDVMYDSRHDAIMLVLGQEEKGQIGGMPEDVNSYCSFPTEMTKEGAERFMHEPVRFRHILAGGRCRRCGVSEGPNTIQRIPCEPPAEVE